MRDKLKDSEYFNLFVNEKNKSSIRLLSFIKNGEVVEGRLPIVLESKFKNHLYSLIAKYSAGCVIDDLYSDYYEALDFMYQSWMELDNRAYINDKKFNHYFGDDYDLMLWMISLGFLLNVSEEKFRKLVEIVDKYQVRDLIYETIICAKLKDRKPIEEESYKLIMDMPFVYEKLRQAIHEDNDDYGKERASALIEVFLRKDWYPRHKGFSFHDAHKSKHNAYYGYWSFETAAICIILNLDVSKYENNKYFPKDIYKYPSSRERNVIKLRF